MKPCFLALAALAALACEFCAAERTHYGLADLQKVHPAEADAVAVSPFQIVRLEGLTSAAGQLLNGQQGRTLQWDANRGRFHVQLRGVGVKSLKPKNLKPLVNLDRDILAHQLVDIDGSDPCANEPASVLANRVATLLWFLGLQRLGDCTKTSCDLFRGIQWNKDCEVHGISLPGVDSLSGNFSALSDFEDRGGLLEAMRPLQRMDLAKTRIEGHLGILEAMPNLKALNLSMTRIVGRLEVFQFTPQLEELDLAHSSVQGNVKVFESLPSLRSLRLRRTMTEGYAGAFKACLRLEQLDLSWTKVRGFFDFGLPRLKDMDLSGAQIGGDVGQLLRKLRASEAPLRRLVLSQTAVWGTTMSLARWCPMEHLALAESEVFIRLRHFWRCQALRSLNLSRSRTTGDSSGLRMLPQLEELDLSSTKISGSLEVFGFLPKLQRLQLSDTVVDGDISILTTTPDLVRLQLRKTKVSGRFQARPARSQSVELRYLEEVDFSNTEVNGDMSDFPLMPKLKRLALNSSFVAGDLKVLGDKVKELEILEVAFTKVLGNVSTLKALPALREVDVTLTKVAGDITSLSPKLTKAIFSWSHVAGDIQIFSQFQDLTTLALDHTLVHGDIKAFQKLATLTSLNLASCLEVFGKIEVFENALESLRKLDLSSTKITGDIQVIGYPMTVGKLTDILLDNTGVFGDIAVFRNLWKLERVSLSHTNVFGDVENFAVDSARASKFSNVRELSLSFSQVHGCIDHLSSAHKLVKLDLASTAVTGEFLHLMACHDLEMVDLSNTSVNGSFSFIIQSWTAAKLHKLETLRLSNTKITLGRNRTEVNWVSVLTAERGFALEGTFPALKSLDFSGSPLNGNLTDLLKLVGLSRHLHTIEASGCQLTGPFPDLGDWKSPLWTSLGKVALQNNDITWVDAIPPNLIVLDLSRNPQVGLTTGVLKQALDQGVYLDLQDSSLLDEGPARELMDGRHLRMSSYIEMSKQAKGYECHQFLTEKLRVSPDRFLPDVLCQCLPGWEGNGTKCVKCPENFFNAESNSTCKKCPKDSKSPAASTSPDACSCPSGQIFRLNETLQCGCRQSFALGISGDCLECEELKLQCPQPGMKTWRAKPKAGYVRMESNSSKVYLCLSADQCNSQNCSAGFAGPLCVDCAAGYRPVRGSCQACSKEPPSRFFWSILAAGALLSLIGLLVYLCLPRSAAPAAPAPTAALKWKVLTDLAKAQAPVLLQLCQLWAALAVLSSVTRSVETTSGEGHEEGSNLWISTFWELPYVETLQLSLNAFKDSMALQCSYDGARVRFFGALAAPLLPLLILAACGILEVPYPTKGISAALKVLTLLFIGGASSCANLLSCQYVDGADEPLAEHAFRLHMPFLRCRDDSWQALWVDVVAYSSSFVYGLFIPLLLLHLFTRQHLLMRSCRSVAAVTQPEGAGMAVSLQSLTADGKLSFEDSQLRGRLVAACAARLAVSQQGRRLKLRMMKDVVFLEDLGPSSGSSFDGSIEESMVANWIASEEEIKSGLAVRCRGIAEMLMERRVLEEARSERTLTGAKEIFYKYASCRHVWMEVFLKFVSVSLVSSDVGDFGFQLSLSVCLVTAATIALARPYAQPQVNTLHSSCFASLAMASVGFYQHLPLLSRGALLLPFLIAALQLLRPDSAEALSVRLFDELMMKVEELKDGKEVSLDVELWHFL